MSILTLSEFSWSIAYIIRNAHKYFEQVKIFIPNKTGRNELSRKMASVIQKRAAQAVVGGLVADAAGITHSKFYKEH